MNVTAVLLDLDDTLYAYGPCNETALAAVHARLQNEVEVPFARFVELHDHARAELARRLAGQAAAHDRLLFVKHIVEALVERPRPELILDLHACYWRAFLERIEPQPDGHRVLGRLGESYRLAVVSNQMTLAQLEKIRRLGYAPYLSAVVTSEEVGCEKPDPRVFEAALARLGARASQAVMVGDDPERDIGGAHRAGLRTIHISEFTGPAAGEVPADHRIERLAELLDLL